jgi:hypothetical protein
LQDYAPAPGGPQVVSLAQGARPAPPPRDQNGLVPRGMLNGPQLVAMPVAAPEQGHVAIPVPPQVLASRVRANRR